MTRQEAIQVIRANGMFYVPRDTSVFSMLDEAWTIAINSLEAWSSVSDELASLCDGHEDPEEDYDFGYIDGVRQTLEIINEHLVGE